MAQVPATAAIEYVAACWVSDAGGDFCPGVLLSGGSFARGTFVRGLMPVPPSSMRIRIVLAFCALAS